MRANHQKQGVLINDRLRLRINDKKLNSINTTINKGHILNQLLVTEQDFCTI